MFSQCRPRARPGLSPDGGGQDAVGRAGCRPAQSAPQTQVCRGLSPLPSEEPHGAWGGPSPQKGRCLGQGFRDWWPGEDGGGSKGPQEGQWRACPT